MRDSAAYYLTGAAASIDSSLTETDYLENPVRNSFSNKNRPSGDR
jgi:hypothetical protein